MAHQPIAPGVVFANRPGNPKTQFDGLPFFGNRKVGDVDSSEIARQLIARDVAGVSHKNGREANLAAYSAHIEAIGKAAADRAVSEWLNQVKV